MIPDWLEKYRRYLPEYKAVKGKDRLFAVLQEVIAHYFWLYSNFEIDERHDQQLRNQFAQIQAQFDVAVTALNAGPPGSPASQRAMKILKKLMPEAVKQDSPKESYNYLFDNLNQTDPSIYRELSNDKGALRKLCRDYFRRHKAKYLN